VSTQLQLTNNQSACNHKAARYRALLKSQTLIHAFQIRAFFNFNILLISRRAKNTWIGVLDICSFCSSRPSEDDFPVPKHAAV
jgi:hypothetical protein